MSKVLQDLIRKAYDDLRKKESEIAEEIRELREACPHSRHTETAKGSTGGWDKDQYWIEYRCPDCGHFWSVDQ